MTAVLQFLTTHWAGALIVTVALAFDAWLIRKVL